jgi:hypothetical protein
MNTEQQKQVSKKQTFKRPVKETVSARDRIKPRGLAGCMKGRIHYDEDADIFNLGLQDTYKYLYNSQN